MRLSKKTTPGLSPQDIINGFNTGKVIFDVAYPVIKDVFNKLAELVRSINIDALSTAKGKRKAIEELKEQVEILQIQNKAAKQLAKVYDKAFEKLGVNLEEIEIDVLPED